MTDNMDRLRELCEAGKARPWTEVETIQWAHDRIEKADKLRSSDLNNIANYCIENMELVARIQTLEAALREIEKAKPNDVEYTLRLIARKALASKPA